MDKLLDWLPVITALVMAAIAIYMAGSQKRQVEATIAKLQAETAKNKADVSTSAVMAAAAIIDDMREEDHRKQAKILDLEAKNKELKKESLNYYSQLLQAHERITYLEGLNENDHPVD